MNEVFNSYTEEEMKVINIAMFAAQYVGAPAPQTAEELKAFCEEALNDKRKEEEKKAKAKKKEEEKAKEKGLTVEEFRKLKGKKSAVTRVTREIEELERELKAKKAYLTRVKKEIEELEGKES